MPSFATKPASAMGKSNNHGRQSCTKQFWRAGEYEGVARNTRRNIDLSSTNGFDHARMHPKFLHSNATSHKWALGAFAELLDNALDEVHNGATYVNVDVLDNKKDGSKMLLVEDNGGGMDPEKMRKCMSLGYSEKSKKKDTIGQYGNGFKTSTMRLGADVIVFSRTSGTQSIGLLSYTFLRSTGKEDIVVPILDYERRRGIATEMLRSSSENWNKNLETILEWSPFESDEELKNQFRMMKQQGTRIIIYNLWEDDEGNLELDLDSEAHDIQMRGVNRDAKNIQMAEQYPNSRHFLTYRHSLRSYAAIIYLRLPPNFRIILRGKDVEHHNILNDLMWPQHITYRPKPLEKEETYITKKTKKGKKDTNMVAEVTLGFVKDAENHLDVQGFNVYHRNRLIMPFWRVWNAAGSDGRGVIGVIEADYINPAHDKQGFEHTVLLDRLKQKLAEGQKDYWCTNCHKIGYAPRRNKKAINEEREAANKSGNQGQPVLDSNPDTSSSRMRAVLDSNLDESSSRKKPVLDSNLEKSSSRKRSLPDPNTNVAPHKSQKVSSDKSPNGNGNIQKKITLQTATKSSTRRPEIVSGLSSSRPHANKHKASSPTPNALSGIAHMKAATSDKQAKGRNTDKAKKNSEKNVDEVVHHSHMEEDSLSEQEPTPCGTNSPTTTISKSKGNDVNVRCSPSKGDLRAVEQPRKEKQGNVAADVQTERCKSRRDNEELNQEENNLKKQLLNASNTIRELRTQLQKANEEIKKLNMQQDERARRDKEENRLLKNQLEKANEEISELNKIQKALIELLQEERDKVEALNPKGC
ncbi:hypothetical protein ACLB2K_054604 [Fragaria x ananassa]